MLAVLFLLVASCIGSAQEQPAKPTPGFHPGTPTTGAQGTPVIHPSTPTTGAPGTPVNEEYRVYEAVLKQMDTIPKQDPHVEIYERTLTTKCALKDETPIFAKGCSFFWVKPDTDDDVEHTLRVRFHGLSHATWKNFKENNAASITLHDPIAAPWKHKFTGPYNPPNTPIEDAPEAAADPSTPTERMPETPPPAEVSDEWASPDMTIYLSRVGFDKKKTEALVYVLVFSYSDRIATTGDYLRFRQGADKQWTPAGRVSYLKQDSNLTASFRLTTPSTGIPGSLPATELK